MSNCGNCRNKVCGCVFAGDNTSAQVTGIGTSYTPYKTRSITPPYRAVGSVRQTSTQVISANTDIALIFHATDIPTTSPSIDMWKVATPTRLTVPYSGLYLVGGYLSSYNPGGGVSYKLWVAKNGVAGTPLVKRTVNHSVGGYGLRISTMTLVRLAIDDYIELYARSSPNQSGTNNGGLGGRDDFPYFWAAYIGAY